MVIAVVLLANMSMFAIIALKFHQTLIHYRIVNFADYQAVKELLLWSGLRSRYDRLMMAIAPENVYYLKNTHCMNNLEVQ